MFSFSIEHLDVPALCAAADAFTGIGDVAAFNNEVREICAVLLARSVVPIWASWKHDAEQCGHQN
jgi:hypothetical protein